MSEAQPLQQLLEQRGDLWRGRRRPSVKALPSGRAELDSWLPDGGWPCGCLIELLPETLGSGELELLLPVLAAQTRQGWPVMLIAPPMVPCPQRLQRAGVALERLVIVRDPSQALWVSEQALKSGLCGLILIWHPRGRVKAPSIRRLQLAARSGSAPAVLCYQPGQLAPPSLAALRLSITPGPALSLLRGDGPSRSLHLGRGNVIALADRRKLQRSPA